LAPVAIKKDKNTSSVIQLHAVESKQQQNLTSSNVSLKSTGHLNLSKSPASSGEFGVHIVKWLDYTSKYGLAYLLSDGTTGSIFNDLTKLTLSPDENNFEYIQKKNGQQREVLSVYSTAKCPTEIQKKMALLQYFKSYLEGKNDISIIERENNVSTNKTTQKTPKTLIYVKSWMHTKNAVMFRLSNSLIQIEFSDKTQILLNSKLQMVHYKNKKGEYSQHKLATAMEVDYPEMVKRLKYTKQILVHCREAKVEDKKGTKLEVPGSKVGSRGFKEYEIGIDSITARDGHSEMIPKTSAYKGMSRIKSYVKDRY